ncbi:hypothetical protein ACIBJE_13230 [Micromonospora sp. NPDC050187]|uniref:hypothetical protein n=1 Tax=Micromonospora sp. NPDC050187 TaxID=3364277 RepID=UPI003799D991
MLNSAAATPSTSLSAVTAAPELLPQPWGALGQWLPVGAGGTLLRSAAFFDGAGAGQALAVLTGYAVIGVGLTLVGRRAPADAVRALSDPAGPAPVPATVTG